MQAPVKALLQSIQLGEQAAAGGRRRAQAGVAQVLYGLGVAIGTDQGAELPALYLRLSSLLDPTADLTILSLGDVFQTTAAARTRSRSTSRSRRMRRLRRNADLQIEQLPGHAQPPDEAATYAKRVVDANPKDVEAIIQLGNVYRANDQFADAADAYTKGIEAEPAGADWRILYYRGVSYTMADQWPKAEADFQKALMLNPGQPQVLNYLGYSWVDQGVHLDEALNMIKMASDQRPNDGYIVDSLGWAYYRLGRYDDAVTALERAVKLSPGRVDAQRSPRRRLLAGRAQARSDVPVGTRARFRSRAGRPAGDHGQAGARPRRGPVAPPRPRRRSATAGRIADSR